jgi:sigma-B regulation protein RsbU (phosphoserine phosphatase)
MRITEDGGVMLQEENKRLKVALEELSTLNDLARVISSTMDLDTIIDKVVHRSIRAVHAQQGMITLIDENNPEVMRTLIRTNDSKSDQKQYHLNQNILGWMIKNNKPLLSNDFINDNRFPGITAIEGDFKSLLCVPLIVKNRLIGILATINKKDGNLFSEYDQRLLSIIGMQSAQVLENARLYEQEKSLHSIREEIRLAAKIQFELLPKKFPDVPGYEIVGKTIPAQLVGGDYFDFIPIDEKRIALALGDVSGKGLPASLLMANLQATLRSLTLVSGSVCECICRSNKLLFHSTSPEKFVTLFYGVLDFEKHQFNYCNAGHNPPMFFSDSDESVTLNTGGIVLSMMEKFDFVEETVCFKTGDVLVIYSDGISEAINKNKEEFGEENIEKIVKLNRMLTANELAEKIFHSVTSHMDGMEAWDDMTLLVIKKY